MKDCFAYRARKCLALKKKNCGGCSFYKTKEQYELDQQRAMERIFKLDKDKKDYIIKTYYGGKTPAGAREYMPRL